MREVSDKYVFESHGNLGLVFLPSRPRSDRVMLGTERMYHVSFTIVDDADHQRDDVVPDCK